MTADSFLLLPLTPLLPRVTLLAFNTILPLEPILFSVITEDMMERPKLTHESRCLVILVGGVLERCIEDHARSIAANRASVKITPEDINNAVTEFFGADCSDLPQLIEQAINNYQLRSSKAA